VKRKRCHGEALLGMFASMKPRVDDRQCPGLSTKERMHLTLGLCKPLPAGAACMLMLCRASSGEHVMRYIKGRNSGTLYGIQHFPSRRKVG
jgi:hypothetical protein